MFAVDPKLNECNRIKLRFVTVLYVVAFRRFNATTSPVTVVEFPVYDHFGFATNDLSPVMKTPAEPTYTIWLVAAPALIDWA